MIKKEILDRWTPKKSEELYGIKNWGAGYYNINSSGEVTVSPFGENSDVSVSLMDIISGIKERGLDMPVLLRFENLLDAQISNINESFKKAMDELNYKGEYRGVYPIKVISSSRLLKRWQSSVKDITMALK